MMDDLISRAAAIAWFFRPCSNEEYYSNLDVERALKAIPTVDAVPVVRCKDCTSWEADWKPNNAQDGEHFCPMVSLVTRGDWFCADGERRENHD